MISSLLQHLQVSEAATYAFILSTIAPLAYNAPKYIALLGGKVINSLFHSFEFHYSEESYGVINSWLSKNINSVILNRNKRVVSNFDYVNESFVHDDEEYKSLQKKWMYVPSYGSYLIKTKDNPLMFIRRTKEEKKEIVKPTDTIYISVPFWNKDKAITLFEQIQKEAAYRTGSRVFMSSRTYFYQIGSIEPDISKPLFTKESLDLLSDVKSFFENESIYHERGVPYKKGYMLYGFPGTGKSKIIEAIARTLEKDVYIISNYDFTSNLSHLLNKIPKGSIILAEDIDTFDIKKRTLDGEEEDQDQEHKKDKPSSSLGAILNALDGINSYSGSALFMTTNKIDLLDSALIRPGRIDVKVEIGKLRDDELINFFSHFYKTKRNYKYIGDENNLPSISDLYNKMMNNWSDEQNCADLLELKEV